MAVHNSTAFVAESPEMNSFRRKTMTFAAAGRSSGRRKEPISVWEKGGSVKKPWSERPQLNPLHVGRGYFFLT